MVTNSPHLGIGLYSLADVVRFTGASAATVRRWGSSAGIVPRHFADEGILTFEELMELQFVQMFRHEGVSFQAIRKASVAASKKFDTPYPFTSKQFDTDGKTIFATLIKEKPRQALIEDLEKGQYVFASIMRPFFRKLEYPKNSERVARYWPLNKHGRIVLDPQRRFGKPIDAETGIPTGVILEAVNAGDGQKPEVVARWLGIPLAAVKAALAFEKSLAA